MARASKGRKGFRALTSGQVTMNYSNGQLYELILIRIVVFLSKAEEEPPFTGDYRMGLYCALNSLEHFSCSVID